MFKLVFIFYLFFFINRLATCVEKVLSSFGKKIWKNGTSRMQSGHPKVYCITETVERRPKILKYVCP